MQPLFSFEDKFKQSVLIAEVEKFASLTFWKAKGGFSLYTKIGEMAIHASFIQKEAEVLRLNKSVKNGQ